MGFEQAPGPIPTRKQQLDMINKLEDDWLSQPFYKYYMNEDLRKPKMAFAEHWNKTKSEFAGTLLIYGLMYLPVVVLMRRFFITRGGIPMIMRPNYFNKLRTPAYARQLQHVLWAVPTWIILTVGSACLSTDFHKYIGDEFYKVGVKPPRML